MSFIARSEDFGGLLAPVGSENVIFLDHMSFDVVKAVSSGISRAKVLQAAQEHFDSVSVDLAIKKANAVFDILDGRINGPEADIVFQSNLDRFPTLSAPLDLYWEITRRCNETCQHCYNNSSPTGFNPSYENIKRIVDELSPYRMRELTLTGGEPMMRRDFWKIVSDVRPLCNSLVMGTNATLIDSQNIDIIEENFDILNISLDDPDEQSFDKFRGYKGAFKRTLNALQLLKDRDVKVYIQTVLTSGAVERLEQLGEILSDLNIDSWVIRFAFDSGRAVENKSEFLTGEEIFNLQGRLHAVKEQFIGRMGDISVGANYPWSYQEPYQYTKNPSKLQTCAAATTNAAIDAFGRLAPCPLFTETDFKTASVYQGSFLKEWKQAAEFEALRTLKLDEVKGCGTCKNATTICGGGCRAKAYMKYGTIKKNDYSCNYSR